VNVQGPWGLFTAPAWSTGCHLQTPATVSFATSGLQWSANPGHWWRSVPVAHLQKLGFNEQIVFVFDAVKSWN